MEGETIEAEKIREVVAGEEAIAAKAAGEANAIKEDCEKDLTEAMPVLKAASEALDCITKNAITFVEKLPRLSNDLKIVLSTACALMLKPEVNWIQILKKIFDYWPTAVKRQTNMTF